MRHYRVALAAGVAALAVVISLDGSAQAHARRHHHAVAAPKLGLFSQHGDVGTVSSPGTVVFTPKSGVYRITASGANIWGTQDAFHYIDKPASGDLSITADVAWLGQGTDPHRKAGVMIRQSLAPDAPYADIMVHGSGLVSLQYRETAGAETHEIQATTNGASRIRLDYQNGYAYISLAGKDGVFHHAGGEFPVRLKGPYLVGLAVSAHNNAVRETADISDVTIAPLPPAPVSKGYADKVESTLEVLDLNLFNRTVVYQTSDHIEAPNWLPDGKMFLFNAGGSLYTLPVAGGTPTRIDTGALNKINNDHGFSPDHTQLAISDQTSADNVSRVYVLPIGGGTPRQITAQGPSYWHGWSPDGKTLAVVANRGGDFDIYAIPAAGGSETRLTTAPGLDDGAEYSPDGQWIYFNSVRSGNMKIWRMHADGSGQEQVTFGDDSRDWFPHISPDGKWIAFVSFGTEVAIGDHPPDHDVMIKLMPGPNATDAKGATPRVIAKLFGGQGTMNVNSWSPDSTHLAFVSYRVLP